MNYFAILGKTPVLSLRELELVKPLISFSNQKGHIVVFETDFPERLSALAGIIKRGKVVEEKDMEEALEDTALIGVQDKDVGMHLKKTYGIKRFKQTDLDGSDKEVIQDGTEVIVLQQGIYGIVTGYQDITRFEVIDMQKPIRGMEIGMMPAKLTQILVNIGVGLYTGPQKVLTVFDPFCGFGTTGFVANSLGYNFIGSDTNITPSKQNLPRWKTSAYYKELPFTLFKHDVFEAFDKPFLKAVDVIVTEGWLGPVVHHQMSPAELQKNLVKVEELYTAFVDQIATFYPHIVVVMTMPEYQKKNATGLDVNQKIATYAETKGFVTEILPELYMRKGQIVARRVVVLKR